jgi:tankyrase
VQASIKGKNDVCVMLLQQGADPTLRNSEGKTALDVADPLTRPVLSEADYRKDELLEVARSGENNHFFQPSIRCSTSLLRTMPTVSVPAFLH